MKLQNCYIATVKNINNHVALDEFVQEWILLLIGNLVADDFVDGLRRLKFGPLIQGDEHMHMWQT